MSDAISLRDAPPASTVRAPDRHARRRLIMIAYACSSVRGSEHGVGWGRVTQAGRVMDTWAICGEDSRADIEAHLARHGPVPGVQFFFAGASRFERMLEQYAHGPFRHNYFAYSLWHRRAFRLAKALHAEIGFDLAHQANTCGYREPGFLWKLGIPFVWGPIGGTQNYPWRFLGRAGVRGALLEAARGLANVIQLRCSPRVRRAMRGAKVVLAANSTGVRDIERAYGTRPLLLLETGLHGVTPVTRDFTGSRPLRILWSGELKPNKGLHLLLAALAKAQRSDAVELRILGSGPEEASLRNVAQRLGVAASCTWLGWRPFAEVAAQYDWADVLAFTSLRDTSGNVMLEAMAKGVPVICLDHQGAADIVTQSCGFKIPVVGPAQVVTALRDVLDELANDRTHLSRRSHAAVERARRFLWDENGRAMADVYGRVLRAAGAESAASVL